MSEIVGYNGPIIMTPPTRAIVPFMLEDYRKVGLDLKEPKEGSKDKDEPGSTIKTSYYYTSEHIAKCMQKVIKLRSNHDFL